MLRRGEDGVARTFLDDLAEPEHIDVIATAKQKIRVSSAVRRYKSSTVRLTGPSRSASAFCSATTRCGEDRSQAGQKKLSSAQRTKYPDDREDRLI